MNSLAPSTVSLLMDGLMRQLVPRPRATGKVMGGGFLILIASTPPFRFFDETS